MSNNRASSFLLAAMLVLAIAPSVGGQEAPVSGATPSVVDDGPSLGLDLSRPWARAMLDAGIEAGARPAFVRLVARWDEIEREAGSFDWSTIAGLANELHDAGFRIVLCLTGSNPIYLPSGGPPSPAAGSSLPAWTAFARSAVRALGDRVHVIEIWDGPGMRVGGGRAVFEPEPYAFLLKTTALAVRAEARGAGHTVRVAQGAIARRDLDWQARLWRNDSAPYVEILPVRVGPGDGPVASVLEEVTTRSLAHPPAPEFWAYVDGDGALRAAVEAVAASASVALGTLPSDSATGLDEARWALGLNAALGAGFAAAPAGKLSIRDAGGVAVPGARILGRFLTAGDLTTLIVFETGEAPGADSPRLVVDTALTRNSRLVDPTSGTERRVPSYATEDSGRRAFPVPAASHPMALLFQMAAPLPGLDLPPEELEVRRERGLTAEEIIAFHQQVQKLQDDRLDRWTGRGRIDFHFKLAQAASTVDVSIESNYFWERGGELEWEQTDYFVNGNRVRWKKIPELPLIQPEKVVTLPLDLTLDRTYTYRLSGEDRVEGRDAYVLEFAPSVAGASESLYRGRVWIDKKSFARLKVSLVQTGLESPVLTNEEIDVYRPVTGPDGGTFWMLSRVDGEQLWKTGGRNFVVRRELTFESLELNPSVDDFELARRAAYASTNQMLRDTREGFRYLERQSDGTRTVKTGVDRDQLFAAAGAFQDSSMDNAVPLAGVNYFNYKLWNRDIQTNVFFAGVFAFVNLTDPAVFGSRMDLAVESRLNGLKGNDKIFRGNVEIGRRRIRTRSQNLSVRYGIPWGDFLKVNLVYDFDFVQFFRDDDGLTHPRFVLPEDHVLTTGTLELEWNRRGWALAGRGSWSGRSDWRPWGIPGSGLEEFDPATQTFTRWSAKGSKEWYLRGFQKLRTEINYLDGSELDRFSRYRFDLFGDDRLSGFSGTGVRFDSGVIGRAGYSFNLFEALRFDLSAETARVKEAGSESQWHAGVGISGNVIGPWKTVISASYGYAVASDVSSLEGEQEFLLLVFKLF